MHMAEVGIKHTNFISNDLFLPHFKKIDPGKKIIDLVAFDGAANVQKTVKKIVPSILSALQFMVVSMLSV